MAVKQRMQENEAEEQLIIITGEEDQGQNIVAMMYVGQALQEGVTTFHNDCSNTGFRINPETLADESDFLELLDVAPAGSTFVIADADVCAAITGDAPDANLEWLHLCKVKGHKVILTTIRGVEHRLKGPLQDTATMHIYVSSPPILAGLFLAVSSGAMRERVPTKWSVMDEEKVIRCAKLTNGLYESPPRLGSELIVSPIKTFALTVDYSDAVRSTATARPKHPENLILLTRTSGFHDHVQRKTTEIVSMPWLEAVNKRRDEEMAVGILEWTCERWGIDLQGTEMNPETTYPDAWGHHEGRKVNLEFRKVQPKWPSGATLASMVDAIRSGKAVAPKVGPLIQCKQCGTWEDGTITDAHVLPEHDINHIWVCTYPKSMIGPEWTEHLTALPNLAIGSGDLRSAVTEAVDEKDALAKRFGEGEQNWLILSVEGFPLDERLHAELADIEWRNLDAVFLILSGQFGSVVHMHDIDDKRIVVVARCPKGNDHVCYHPGVRTIVRKASIEFQGLREESVPPGLVYQVVNSEGRILAEEERVPQVPVTEDDTLNGIKRAVKRLPFQPSEKVYS